MTAVQQPLEEHNRADTPLLNLALALAESLYLLLLFPLGVALAALAVSFTIPASYTASTRIIAAVSNAEADQFVAMLRSRLVTEPVVQSFELTKVYGLISAEDAQSQLARKTEVSRNSAIITVRLSDHDPKRAAEMANALVNTFVRLSVNLAMTEAGKRRAFFEVHMEQVKSKLAKAKAALRGSGLGESAPKKLDGTWMDALARVTADIELQQIKLAFLYEAAPQPHVDVRLLLEIRLAAQELTRLRTELMRLEQGEGQRFGGVSPKQSAIYRDYRHQEMLSQLIAGEVDLAQQDEARVFRVLEPATPPENKSDPRRAILVAESSVVAFVLALIAALLRSHLRRISNDPDSAKKLARLRSLLLLGSRSTANRS